MRPAPLLLLLALASAPRAQNCTPDPTPAASYYPLGVGDEWVYHVFRFGPESRQVYLTRRVLRTETISGREYAVDQTCVADVATGVRTCADERRVRVDTASGDAVALRNDGQEYRAVEGLGRGLGAAVFDCMADYGTRTVIGGISYTVARVKGLQYTDFSPPALASGIGQLSYQDPSGNLGTFGRLEYARVGGVEYGRHPVAGEGDPIDATFALTASPNPTSGTLRLALTLPEAQTICAEAFDALGRRVWQLAVALGAGPQTIPVDARAWAPGVYVVRAVAGQARAAVRVVRR